MATIELTEDNFADIVATHPCVMIDFWAPWCAPCRAFTPIYEQVSHEYPEVVFAKVNTSGHEALATHFEIRSIPTLMVIRDQIIVYVEAGAVSAAALREIINDARALDIAALKAEAEREKASKLQ